MINHNGLQTYTIRIDESQRLILLAALIMLPNRAGFENDLVTDLANLLDDEEVSPDTVWTLYDDE